MWLYIVAVYAVWMAMTDHCRFQTTDFGPLWLMRLVATFLKLIMSFLGVTQETVTTELDEQLRELKAIKNKSGQRLNTTNYQTLYEKYHKEVQVARSSFATGQPLQPPEYSEYIRECFDPDQRCIYAATPHGVAAMAGICLGMPGFRLDERVTNMQGLIAGASVVFYIPIFREILLLFGVRDASKENVKKMIMNKRSVGLNPGGILEMVNTDHTQEKIYCQAKMGFFRLAIQHGMPVVPYHSFGENQLFRTFSFALPLRQWIAKKLRVGIPLFIGRWNCTFLPIPTHVASVVGRLLPCGAPEENPSDERVKKLYDDYKVEMQRIYDKYKYKYLPKEVADKEILMEKVLS